MQVLILGASGLCRSYVKTYLQTAGYTVTGTYHRSRPEYIENPSMIQFLTLRRIVNIMRAMTQQLRVSTGCLRVPVSKC